MYIPESTSETLGEFCAARRRIMIVVRTQALKLLKTSLIFKLAMKAVYQLHLKWQLHRLDLPISAFCWTAFAVASPYPPTLVTASASFSQDAFKSLCSHWDIASIMQLLASWWFALIVFKLVVSINCWPSWNQSPSENPPSWRTFKTFLTFSSGNKEKHQIHRIKVSKPLPSM